MIVIEILIVFVSLFLISLNIKKHKKKVFKSKEISYLRYLVISGWVLLIISACLFSVHYTISIGLTYWFGIVAVDSFILALIYGRFK